VGYIAESRMGRALACLDELVQREPQSPRAWHWRGWVHEWLQQEDMAVEDYRQALELAPARWSSRLRLVRILLGRNRPQEALPHLDELERTHPEDADVQVAQARLLQLNRKGQEAIRLLDQVLISHPHHFEALSLRGALANQYESAAKAEIWLQRALRENSADSVTLYLLQQCLKKQGKDSEATQVLDRLNARNADDRRLEKLWHQELQQTPHNPDLLAEIGAILVRLGDEKKGLTFLYRALEEDENHRAAHETLMRYHASKGDDHKAAEHRERLHRLKSPTPSGSTANK
jgi:tetratricopeptide (TPR) repeat protein